MRFSYRKNKVLEAIDKYGCEWIVNIPHHPLFTEKLGTGPLNDKLIAMGERFLKLGEAPQVRYFARAVVIKALEDFYEPRLFSGLSDYDDLAIILYNNTEATAISLQNGQYTAIDFWNGLIINAVSVRLSEMDGYQYAGVHYVATGHPDYDLLPLRELSLLMLYHLAEIEVKLVDGKNKKQRIDNDRVTNATNIPVKLITSNWFTTIIRTEGFGVKGHFGLRACGPGRSERRLTWIKPYQKHGYTRKARIDS